MAQRRCIEREPTMAVLDRDYLTPEPQLTAVPCEVDTGPAEIDLRERGDGLLRAGGADGGIMATHVMYGLSRDPRLRDELFAHYDALAISLARGFGSRRDQLDDLIQVARIGL